MLCAYCVQVLGVSPLKSADERIHHESASNFKISVDHGCCICSSLWRLLTRDGQLDLASSEDLEGGFTVCSITWASAEASTSFDPVNMWGSGGEQAELEYAPDDGISGMSPLSGDRTPGRKWEVWLSLARNVKPESAEIGCFLLQDASTRGQGTAADSSKSLRPPTPSLLDCQRLACTWFEDCLKCHTNCGITQKDHETTWYPTRLLDIGTAQAPEIGIYVTAEDRPQRPLHDSQPLLGLLAACSVERGEFQSHEGKHCLRGTLTGPRVFLRGSRASRWGMA